MTIPEPEPQHEGKRYESSFDNGENRPPPRKLLPTPKRVIDGKIKKRPDVIKGLLRRGQVLLMGSYAKSNKTWNAMQLAYCIANGLPYLAFNKGTEPGKVLYIDLELTESEMIERFQIINLAFQDKGRKSNLENIDYVSLHEDDNVTLVDFLNLKTQIPFGQYAAVVFDPIYFILISQKGDNDSDQWLILQLLKAARTLARTIDSAVILLHHFSKGDQANKRAIDALSGSGVWGRAAPVLLIFRELSTEDSFQVSTTIRSEEPVPDFAVTYQFPLFDTNTGIDPHDLKTYRLGRPKGFTALRLAGLVSDSETATYKELLRRFSTACQMSEKSFKRYLNEAEKQNFISRNPIDQTYAVTSAYIKKHRS